MLLPIFFFGLTLLSIDAIRLPRDECYADAPDLVAGYKHLDASTLFAVGIVWFKSVRQNGVTRGVVKVRANVVNSVNSFQKLCSQRNYSDVIGRWDSQFLCVICICFFLLWSNPFLDVCMSFVARVKATLVDILNAQGNAYMDCWWKSMITPQSTADSRAWTAAACRFLMWRRARRSEITTA